MDTVGRRLARLVYGLYISMLGVVFALLIAVDRQVSYARMNDAVTLPNLLFTAVAAAVLAALGLWARRRRAEPVLVPAGQRERRRFYELLGALSVLLFAAQLFFCRNVYFLTGWDAHDVRVAVEQLNGDGVITWAFPFERYPNNVFIVFVLSVLWRAATALHVTPDFAYLLVECALVCGAVLLAALTVYELTDSRAAALAGYGLAAALYGLSPWILIPYSDGYAVVFPVASLYAYVRAGKWRLPLLVRQLLVLLPAAVGMLFKPQCAIVLAAIAAAELIRALTGKRLAAMLRAAVPALCAAAVAAGCVTGLTAAGERYTGLYENEDVEMIPLHFVMMGLNPDTDGAYSEYDVRLVQAVTGRENKAAVCKAVIGIRLEDYGFRGLMWHLAKKTLINYNDGTFAWNREGEFYHTIFDPPMGALSETMRSFYYPDGAHYSWFNNAAQQLWVFVLLAGLCGGACAMADAGQNDSGWLTAVLCLLGISLFVTIFEARARYLYIYAPMYVIMAALGMRALCRRCGRRPAGGMTDEQERKGRIEI